MTENLKEEKMFTLRIKRMVLVAAYFVMGFIFNKEVTPFDRDGLSRTISPTEAGNGGNIG